MTLPPHERHTVQVVSSASSALSIAGAAVILLSYALLPQFRSAPRRMLCFLTAADALLALCSLSLIFHTDHHPWACRAYTLTSTGLNLASFLYTAAVSRLVWESVAPPASLRFRASRRTAAVHAACVGAPVAAVTIVASLLPGSSAPQDIGCWMPRRFLALRLSLTYVPLWLAMAFSAWTYAQTVYTGRRALRSQQRLLVEPTQALASIGTQLTRLSLVPAAFVLLRVPGSVNVVKDIVDRDKSLFVVDLLEAFGDQAQAAVHCALLVLGHDGVRKALWGRLFSSSSTSKATAAAAAPPSARP